MQVSLRDKELPTRERTRKEISFALFCVFRGHDFGALAFLTKRAEDYSKHR
jgi:hypothetical protein